MRVQDQNLNGAAAAQTGSAQQVHGADRSSNTRAPSSTTQGDRVELSNTMGALSRAVATHEAGRTARIQELTAQYARGEYRADSTATSRAIVTDAIASAAA